MSGKSPNSSPSGNGWEYQKAAAFYLFLKNLRENKSLNAEGPDQDIEITREDDTCYLAQAKSMIANYPSKDNKSSYSSGANKHLREGISSLKQAYFRNKARKRKCTKFIYISNIRYPFGCARYTRFDNEDCYPYDSLQTDEKKKIIDIIYPKKNDGSNKVKTKKGKAKAECQSEKEKEKYAREMEEGKEAEESFLPKLEMQCFEFPNSPDDDTRYKNINTLIKEFLDTIELPIHLARRMRVEIQAKIDGVVTNENFKITKQDFGAQIAEIRINLFEKDIKEIFTEKYTARKIDKIINLYSESIKSLSNMFIVISRIIEKFYNELKGNDDSVEIIDFARRNMSLLDDYVDAKAGEEDADIVKQCIIYKVIEDRLTFEKLHIHYNV